MKCPKCQQDTTIVRDTVKYHVRCVVKRYRVCTSCGNRFITWERIEMDAKKRRGKKKKEVSNNEHS